MAFCENCGTQLSDAAKFCSSCGKAAGATAASTTSPISKASNPNMNWILGGGVLLGLLGLGAALYFSHRSSVSPTPEAQAAAILKGIPDVGPVLNALQSPAAQSPAATPASPTPAAALDENKTVTPEQGQCALFSKEELTRVLGTNFTHADADATGCTYKGDGPREFVRTEALWTGGRKLVKEKSDALADMRHSMSNLHYTKAEIASHGFPITPYPGVGDEGYVNLWNVITARKGDVGIVMDLRYYHDSDDLTRMFTNAALSRLAGSDATPAAISTTNSPAPSIGSPNP